MYRVNPLQYITKGLLSVTLAGAPVYCSGIEYLLFDAPPDATCQEYMASYLASNSGFLLQTNPGEQCQFCPSDTADDFLASIDASFGERWMNFGLVLVFIAFNIAATFLLYYVFRIPRSKKN
jgi:ABC-type multidrug transport system permease subunit